MLMKNSIYILALIAFTFLMSQPVHADETPTQVIIRDTATITLTSEQTTVVAGTQFRVRCTVQGTNIATPSGNIEFYVDGVLRGIVALTGSGDTAYADFEYVIGGVGDHTITAVYPESTYYEEATGNVLGITILPNTATTTSFSSVSATSSNSTSRTSETSGTISTSSNTISPSTSTRTSSSSSTGGPIFPVVPREPISSNLILCLLLLCPLPVLGGAGLWWKRRGLRGSDETANK